jgi:CubicO group peptidase (beta-lactamase class C family)
MFSRTNTKSMLLGMVAAIAAAAPAARAVPITGMPVPELANFDQLMSDFMDNNGIEAGLLGIMKDGVIVYQRGFGWKDASHTQLLRHDAVMRIASCTKPFTAAAIQRLYASGALDPNDIVFDLGQPGGGVLPYIAFDGSGFVQYPNMPDPRMEQIKVKHILAHRSGLPPNNSSDPMFREVEIADDFNDAGYPTSYPPGRVRTTQWVLGGALASNPGVTRAYSNFGFQVLGQVVEAASGMTHIDYVKQNILGPIDWMPLTEVVYGRTFEVDLDPREPWYDNYEMAQNVFDPDGDQVRRPHGGYHHELHFASGAMVVSTTAMLHLAETYYVNGEVTYGAPTNGARDTRSHGGLLYGTESCIQQRDDGANFAIIFNKGTGGTTYAPDLQALINTEIDNGGFAWPTQGVDGQWVDFNNGAAGDGSYEDSWSDFQDALDSSPAEATLDFKTGDTNWTGTINQVVRLRAPQSGVVARIGQQ